MELPSEPTLNTSSLNQTSTPVSNTTECVSTFNKTVIEFVEELKSTFPELEDIVNERYTSLSNTDDSVMKWFELNAKEHHLSLTTKDESLFKNHSSLFLLPDINFSQLWKCKLTNISKNAVWKYLHVLLLLVSHNKMSNVAQEVGQDTVPVHTLRTTSDVNIKDGSNNDTTHAPDMQKMFEQWNTMLDDKELSEEQLKNMKEQSENIMRLMESLNNKNEGDEGDDDDVSAQSGGGEGNQDNPFVGMENDPFLKQLENSKIAQFAKELSNELEMKDLGLSEDEVNINSFQDVFGMMGKNPQKLMGLVKTVGDKIQNKMQTGDIQQTELVSEAQNLMQSMSNSGVFKNMFKGGKKGKGGLDPQALFQNLAKNMNLDANQFDPAMMQNMMAKMQQAGGIGDMLTPQSGSGATRARLQKKLAQQQKDHSVETEQSNSVPKKKKKKKKKKNSPTTD